MARQLKHDFNQSLKMGYAFIFATFSPDRPWEISANNLRKELGHHTTRKYKRLRPLLQVADPSYDSNGSKCKGYVLSELRRRKFRAELMSYEGIKPASPFGYSEKQGRAFDYELTRQRALLKWQEQLETGEFQYQLKSHRLWHGAQTLPDREKHGHLRSRLFAEFGYLYNYDIDACAATLLSQQAKMLEPSLELPFIEQYLEHKSVIRSSLSVSYKLEIHSVKAILNAMLAGGRLIPNKASIVFTEHFWSNYLKAKAFADHGWVIGYADDIKRLWQVLSSPDHGLMERRYDFANLNKDGLPRLIPITSSDKWDLYFRLERQVMDAIRNHIQSIGIRWFNEHDGIRTSEQLDTNHIQQLVHSLTGFRITLTDDHPSMMYHKQAA